jgi:hypothetical protein
VSDLTKEPGSFRDKNNQVIYLQDKVCRCLSPEALEDWRRLEAARFYAELRQEGKLVASKLVDVVPSDAPPSSPPWSAMLEHETIPFISYAYEWSFGMLKEAALLQLELLRLALGEGMILKDATPFNFQWLGTRPVFIDIPSFTRWIPGHPWMGYRQFCEMFLYPLFLQAYRDIPFHGWLRGSIDGFPLEACRHVWSLRDLFRPGILTHVFLHAGFQKEFAQTERTIKNDLQGAGFHKELILANVRRLEKLVMSLRWRQSGSEWSGYADERNYAPTDLELKRKFVREFARQKPRRLVWDLGCNTGEFSRIAAETGATVVAMDSDPWVVEKLYRELRAGPPSPILPLVMNLSDPTPALGWRGMERKALTGRGRPDLTLCLALAHHLVITANVPLPEFILWLAELGSDLVIEFVMPEDPQVQRLLRNKEGRHDDYNRGHFEQLLRGAFEVQEILPLPMGTRYIYSCRKK